MVSACCKEFGSGVIRRDLADRFHCCLSKETRLSFFLVRKAALMRVSPHNPRQFAAHPNALLKSSIFSGPINKNCRLQAPITWRHPIRGRILLIMHSPYCLRRSSARNASNSSLRGVTFSNLSNESEVEFVGEFFYLFGVSCR